MQELRFVLIIVGALAIAALLFHGLWTSKKEGKAKFGNKPLGKLDVDNDDADVVPERAFAPEDDFEIIKKERKEPGFVAQDEIAADPLIDGYQEVDTTPVQSFTEPEPTQIKEDVELDVPSFSSRSIDEVDEIIEPCCRFRNLKSSLLVLVIQRSQKKKLSLTLKKKQKKSR